MDEEKRICDVCGKAMNEGFVIGDGERYYCSEQCLHSEMAEEEYLALYREDEAYWTQWWE